MPIKQSSEELQFQKSEFHWTVLISVIRIYELAFKPIFILLDSLLSWRFPRFGTTSQYLDVL